LLPLEKKTDRKLWTGIRWKMRPVLEREGVIECGCGRDRDSSGGIEETAGALYVNLAAVCERGTYHL
jgi:hypothetical protein